MMAIEAEQMKDRYINTQEAMELSGFSGRFIRLLLEQGRIKGRKPGRDWIIDRKSLEEYVASERKKGRPRLD